VCGVAEGGVIGPLAPTGRGFLRAEFSDLSGAACSIQESSLATEGAIWLGCNKGEHHHLTGDCLCRMHVSRELAASLIPLLQHFVNTGLLPSPESE
jgi:hypothetical protein